MKFVPCVRSIIRETILEMLFLDLWIEGEKLQPVETVSPAYLDWNCNKRYFKLNISQDI